MGAAIKPVYAFVDWHNVQLHFNPAFNAHPRKHLPDALLAIQRQVAAALRQGRFGGSQFRVTLRIYHGWHREREATPIRRAFESLEFDQSLARRFSNVSFARGFQFGNELACHSDPWPLYSTYRSGGQEVGQKMVDAAIICDVLHLLRFGLADVAVIVSDDDDYIPVLLTAKAWSANAILIRRPESGIDHVTDIDCNTELAYWTEE